MLRLAESLPLLPSRPFLLLSVPVKLINAILLISMLDVPAKDPRHRLLDVSNVFCPMSLTIQVHPEMSI